MARHVHTMDPAEGTFLAADVGGTHARVGLAHRGSDGTVHIADYTTYVGAEFGSLGQILHQFVTEHDSHVCHCVLACAGYAIDEVVINCNLRWTVDIAELRRDLGFRDLSLINDFEALAYATPYIDDSATILLSAGSVDRGAGPVVVAGPGTGLGSAVFVPDAQRPAVLATEAGQINLAPGNELEAQVLSIVARKDPYVSYEHVLSGPGLVNLYRALGECCGKPTPLDDPKAITRSALLGDDALTRQTLDTFCAWLGSFAGNLVMMYNANGGVYLAGGIVPHIRDFIVHSDFLARFLAKGQTRAFLERVPVRLIEHGRLGVVGAASWYLNHHGGSAKNTANMKLQSMDDACPIVMETCPNG